MFDIISFVREKIFRRPKLTQELAGEELTEKQTTKLGYFLLYCMFWAILMSAQWTLSIIKDIPEKPLSIPNCVVNLMNDFDDTNGYYYNDNYYWYNSNDCQLISTNPQFDFSEEFNSLDAPQREINNLKRNLQDLESQKYQTELNGKTAQEKYNTSLLENIANDNSPIYNENEIQWNIEENRTQIDAIETQIQITKNSIDTLRVQNKDIFNTLKREYNQAQDNYKTSYLIYRLYVALLSFLFAITVFVVLYKLYIKQKIKNSPHTVIFSVATFAYGLVLLQISCLFIWDIIPHKIFELIFKFFLLFTPLMYLVQFLWPILIIAIFWFMVYKIQKRLYSPKNVLKRFISDKKCPACWNGVDFTKPFCPLCSHEIQIHCPHCKELTLKGMPFCSSCWWKLEDNVKTPEPVKVVKPRSTKKANS